MSNYHLNIQVFIMYLDVRAKLSIYDLRLPSDRRTILIGRWSHPAIIPSPGEVSIRMNIIFTPMNHLKQLSQYEWFVSCTETPYRKCRKHWTRFSGSEIRQRVGQVWELRDLKPVPLQKAAQIDIFTLVNPKVSLCSARRGKPRSILLTYTHNPGPRIRQLQTNSCVHNRVSNAF